MLSYKFKNFQVNAVQFLLVLTYNSYSQGTTVPPPESANLGSSISATPSLYSGKLNINIPLYNIKAGSLEIPVSLSYNMGGIRVSQFASSCGLGWSLNTGGIVTRQVRGGLPDERLDSGYLSFKYDLYN